MGDYTKNGTKIGTCGNAYYSTLPMLEKQANTGDSDINYYLKPENKCTFAFPFPEYDGKQIGQISNFHEEDRVDFFIRIKKEGARTHHKDIIHHIHPKGGQGINLFHDCPYSSNAKISSNFDSNYLDFRLVSQAYTNDGLAVVGKCIYCEETNVFEKHEAVEVCEELEKRAIYEEREATRREYINTSNKDTREKNAAYIREIAKRIFETYK